MAAKGDSASRTESTVRSESVPAPPPHGRTRSVLTAVLVVLSVVATVLALLAVWTFRTLTDTDLFVSRVGSVIEEPQVAQAVADTTAERLVVGIGLEDRVADRLPAELERFAPTLAGAAESTLAREAGQALQSEGFREAWDETLRVSHGAAVGLLAGEDTRLLSTDEGVIALDLTPVMAAVAERDGVLDGLLERPAVQDGAGSTLAAVEERLGVDLPESAGQVVLFESDDLAAAQDTYQAMGISVWLAPVVALLLVLLALAFSRRRLATLLHVVLGVAVVLVLLRLVVQPVRSAVVGSVADAGLAAAVAAAFDSVLSSLLDGIVVAAVVGLLALGGLVALGWSDRRGHLIPGR